MKDDLPFHFSNFRFHSIVSIFHILYQNSPSILYHFPFHSIARPADRGGGGGAGPSLVTGLGLNDDIFTVLAGGVLC